MSTVTINNDRRFDSQSNVTILDSALINGVFFPYSCRKGRCNTCKTKVLNGKTTAIIDEAGLSKDELSEGWILACARTADTNLNILLTEFLNIKIPQPQTLPCRIVSLDFLTNDVLKVTLKLPPNNKFSFLPGQYIDIIGANNIRRSYSLANPITIGQCNLLELHISKVKNGAMSHYWFESAKPNDLLRFVGPHGSFFMRNPADLDIYFLATGTGIAPIKSIVNSLHNLNFKIPPKSVSIIWGGRNSNNFYLKEQDFINLNKFIIVKSQPETNWFGPMGYVQNTLINIQPNLKNAAVYACGSSAMIKDAYANSRKFDLEPTNFYSDAFVCSS